MMKMAAQTLLANLNAGKIFLKIKIIAIFSPIG